MAVIVQKRDQIYFFFKIKHHKFVEYLPSPFLYLFTLTENVNIFLPELIFLANICTLNNKSAVYHSNINDDMKNNTWIDAVCFKCDYCVYDSCN